MASTIQHEGDTVYGFDLVLSKSIDTYIKVIEGTLHFNISLACMHLFSEPEGITRWKYVFNVTWAHLLVGEMLKLQKMDVEEERWHSED